MSKTYLLGLIICLNSFFAFSQEDYVIEKPIDKRISKFDSIPNPDFTNYFLNSSALTLKKGDIRLSNTDILFTKGSFGFTEKSTISASISLIGTFIGSFKQKIELKDNLNLGFSASIGQLAALPTDSVIFFVGGQSMVTLGDNQNNITFGLGYYFAKSSFTIVNNDRKLFLSNVYISTLKQVSRRIYLVAEGMYFGNYNLFSGSLGLKVIIKTNITLGFGIMPLAHRSGNIGRSNLEATALPILSFRMLFD